MYGNARSNHWNNLFLVDYKSILSRWKCYRTNCYSEWGTIVGWPFERKLCTWLSSLQNMVLSCNVCSMHGSLYIHTCPKLSTGKSLFPSFTQQPVKLIFIRAWVLLLQCGQFQRKQFHILPFPIQVFFTVILFHNNSLQC